MRQAALFFIIISLLFGCRPNKELDMAKNLIHSKPDSSLVILKEWKALKKHLSKKEQAEYSLLMSMALDKNYIDVTSDTLIQPAVKYYSSQQGENRMLSYYYQGLVFKNMGSYSAAIVSLEKAEEDAKALSNFLYLGLIYRNKTALFNEMGDIGTAIQCAKESLDHFTDANAQLYAQYAQLTLANVLFNDQKYDDALLVLDSLSHETNDIRIRSHLTVCKARNLWAKDCPANEVLALYRAVPKSYFDILDYGRLADTFERIGQKDSADYWLKVGYNLAPTENYKATLDYRRADLEKSRGHYRTAYELLDHVTSYQDSLTRVRLAESISAAQRDYFKQDRDLQAERARSAAASLYLWIAISVFVLVLISLLFILQMNKKEARLREGLASLHSSEVTINKLSSDNAFLVGGLVNEKLKDLDALSNEYCLADSEADKDAITKRYKAALEKLRNNPEVIEEIEDLLNRYFG